MTFNLYLKFYESFVVLKRFWNYHSTGKELWEARGESRMDSESVSSVGLWQMSKKFTRRCYAYLSSLERGATMKIGKIGMKMYSHESVMTSVSWVIKLRCEDKRGPLCAFFI